MPTHRELLGIVVIDDDRLHDVVDLVGLGLHALARRAKIILLSAKAMLSERLAGLEAGADDYVVKPFDLRELVARIRAVTRRAATPVTARNTRK